MDKTAEGNVKRTATKNAGVALRLAAAAGFVCLFAYLALSQLATAYSVEAKIAAVQSQIAYEESVKAELEKKKDMLGSDAFIEQMARENFQMVFKDEIVFAVSR